MAKTEKKKSFGKLLGLVSGVLGIVTAVAYFFYSNSVQHFNLLVFVLILAAGISCGLMVITKLKLAPLLSGVLFASAFGAYVNDRVIMFEEMINKIYGMTEAGAILEIVLAIFALILLCFILTTAVAFTADGKAVEERKR